MTIPRPDARPSTPLSARQVAGVVMAGVTSFGLAVAWQMGGSGWLGESDHLNAEVAEARVRPSPLPAQAPHFTGAPAASASTAQVDPSTSSGVRINRMVVRDPFGPMAPEKIAMPEPVVMATPPPPAIKPQPPKPLLAAAPPAPQAPLLPALPFLAVGFIQGQKIGNGKQQAFIQQGDEVKVVQQGDVISNLYRVDEVSPAQATFTHLPSGQKQFLLFSDNSR